MRPLAQVLAAALVIAGAGCGGSGSGEQTASPAPGPTQAETQSATPGRERAPTIAGTSLDNEALSLVGHRGRPVLVNVWSSW